MKMFVNQEKLHKELKIGDNVISDSGTFSTVVKISYPRCKLRAQLITVKTSKKHYYNFINHLS